MSSPTNQWLIKSREDFGRDAYTEEEYIYLATINRFVYEGSETYLDRSLCLWRAAAVDDRDLIQYFIDLEAPPEFGYAGAVVAGSIEIEDYLQDYRSDNEQTWISIGLALRKDLYPPLDTAHIEAWGNIIKGQSKVLEDGDLLKSIGDWVLFIHRSASNSQNVLLMLEVMLRLGQWYEAPLDLAKYLAKLPGGETLIKYLRYGMFARTDIDADASYLNDQAISFYFLGKSGDVGRIEKLVGQYISSDAQVDDKTYIGLWIGYLASGYTDTPDILKGIDKKIRSGRISFNFERHISSFMIRDLIRTGYKTSIKEFFAYFSGSAKANKGDYKDFAKKLRYVDIPLLI